MSLIPTSQPSSKAIYNPQQTEPEWQKLWESQALFQDSAKLHDAQGQAIAEHQAKEKLYLLFAFAYPSGSGLHVGHVESKTALDILARYNRMQGKDVFFPVGWDAFGLPAENYAIKTGTPPAVTTKNAIDTFRRQIKRLGISYDWANEIATNHPEYYKWTQWLFLEMYKKGLAYQGVGMVNWCPSCQTVLANEQVVNGECERCGSKVIQKELKQWYFKITHYQDELLSGLEEVDWPQATKDHQKHWIGKKEGINITYQVAETNEKIVCFTTRPDTNFGATFIVLAPEHEFVSKITNGELPADPEVVEAIKDYVEKTTHKTELERQTEGKKKTGVFTGFYAVNNLNGKKLPIWISDFVLSGFGTAAVVGVPGHDERDFHFAQAMKIPIIRVVVGEDGENGEISELDQVQEESGTMINSEFLDGMDIHQATIKMMDHLEEKGWGRRVTTYKLRDWLISRQRYWGAPIPIVYDPEGNAHPVKSEHLPWLLPTDVEFKPTGQSPLTYSKEFQERTEKLYGKGWRPEYDTMDTFVDSSWYYLRYLDSRNTQKFASNEQLQHWLPVDMYMIGPEHIVLHLLYSRFFTKFLRDEGYLTISEPFQKMRHQGMILGPDGKKMSKSKGNVINPDEVIEKYGADTLRVYEMFMGPIESDKPWSTTAVSGVYRFLHRAYQTVLNTQPIPAEPVVITPVKRKLHQTIAKVSDDIAKLKFNTAIASMMELINLWEATVGKHGELGSKAGFTQAELVAFIKVLAPFAPFLAEELYHIVEGVPATVSIHTTKWPTWDPKLAQAEAKIIPIQVNGKVRAQLEVAVSDLDNQDRILAAAKELEAVQARLAKHQVLKELYIRGKVVNFVVAE